MKFFKKCWIICIIVGCVVTQILWGQFPINAQQAPVADIAQLQQILQDPTTSKQAWIEAAVRLAEIGTDEARAVLVKAFVARPENAKSTFAAIRAIDAQHGWKTYLALAQSEELQTDVRSMAIFGLSEHKVQEAREIFMDLTNSKQEKVRCAAIIGLGDLQESQAVPLLFQMAHDNECSPENRGSAVVLLSKLANDQTEAYLEQLIDSDDQEVNEATRWALADYRNTTRKPLDLKVTELRATIQTPGVFRLSWNHLEPSIGYFIEVMDDIGHIETYLAFPDQTVELRLPQGLFICFMRCILPDAVYSAYWDGGAAEMCKSVTELTIPVKESVFQQVSAYGISSPSLASVLQQPEQFVDQILFFTGTSGGAETIEPLWSSSTRQDWVFSQNGQSVYITNSPGRQYWGMEERQVAVVAQLKRAYEQGDYRLVSIADWLIEE